MDAARRSNVILPESCLTGRCGTCRCMVDEPENTSLIKPELALVEYPEVKGQILLCCRSANKDISNSAKPIQIHLPEPRLFPAKFDFLNPVTDDVLEVWIRLPTSQFFDYIPGQYVNFLCPLGQRRSYSIFSQDKKTNRLGFYVKNIPNGLFSEYVFHRARLNDLVRIEGPLGYPASEMLRNTERIIFLCTGTGIAPVRSMLESLTTPIEGSPYRGQIYVYWGCRYQSDFFWNPHFETIDVELNFVASREYEVGEKEYVQDVAIQQHSDLQDFVVVAVGSEKMVRDAFG